MDLPYKYTKIMEERDGIIIRYLKSNNNINVQNFQTFYYTSDVITEVHIENMEKGLTSEILKQQIKKNTDPITLKNQPSSIKNKSDTDDNN